VIRRLARKHNRKVKATIAKYRCRQTINSQGRSCNRWNLRAEGVWLYVASDIPVERYYPTNRQWTTNPYSIAEVNVEEWTEIAPLAETIITATSQDRGEWMARKREILERDNHTCRECGSKDGVQVHHRKGRKSGGKHSPANLITLCQKCHLRRTNQQRKTG